MGPGVGHVGIDLERLAIRGHGLIGAFQGAIDFRQVGPERRMKGIVLNGAFDVLRSKLMLVGLKRHQPQ